MKRNTSFRCSKLEHSRICSAADSLNMTITEYILYCLDRNLPLKTIPYLNKNIDRTSHRIGLRIPESLTKKMNSNQKKLSSDIRKIRKAEIFIHCCLLECEKIETS